MNSRAVVVHRDDAAEAVGSQGQALTPLVTSATAGATGLSGGFVRMPPGGVSRAREHAYSEIIVAVLSGDAATVVWENGQPRPLVHGPGEMCQRRQVLQEDAAGQVRWLHAAQRLVVNPGRRRPAEPVPATGEPAAQLLATAVAQRRVPGQPARRAPAGTLR